MICGCSHQRSLSITDLHYCLYDEQDIQNARFMHEVAHSYVFARRISSTTESSKSNLTTLRAHAMSSASLASKNHWLDASILLARRRDGRHDDDVIELVAVDLQLEAMEKDAAVGLAHD